MAQLDKLIDRLQPGQEIVIESGKNPMLRTDAGMKAMLNQQLTTQQIIPLLQEIAPMSTKVTLAQRKPSRFEYTFSEKTVVVLYTPDGESVTAKIAIPGYDEEMPSAGEGEAGQETGPAARPAAGGEPEVNALLRKMFGMGCSDLHLTSNHKPLVRLHGDMQELSDHPVIPPAKMQALLGAILPPHNAAQFE